MSQTLPELFMEIGELEQEYLPGAPANHPLLDKLQYALIVSTMAVEQGIVDSPTHTILIEHCLQIAYQLDRN